MPAPPRDYKVSPDSETAHLLRDAAADSRRHRRDGVSRGGDGNTPYDPERLIQAIYASAGILKRAGVDAEQLERETGRNTAAAGPPSDPVLARCQYPPARSMVMWPPSSCS